MKVRIGNHQVMRFEIWSPVVNTTNQTVTWIKSTDGEGRIDPKIGGDIDLYTDIAYKPGSAVRNLTDVDGVNLFEVQGQAYQMYVVSLTPLVGVDGRLDGYVHRVSTKVRDTTIQVLGNIASG